MDLISAPRIEGTATVRNGRSLSFALFGAIDGKAVVWLHGTPGARRQIPEAAREYATRHGMRIIGVDRPGVGNSTPHLYENVLDFSTDLAMLLDALDINKVAMVGLSGGGPYVLGMAAAFPDRVVTAGVLGSVVPTRGDEAIGGGLVGALGRFGPVVPALRVPLSWLLSGLVKIAKPIASPALDLYARFSPDGDRDVLSRPEVKAMFLDDLLGNSRRGITAPVLDLILFLRPWGFSMADITVPVHWWHGDADNIVPLSHAHHAMSLLPNADLTIRPGESHLGGLIAAEEVLDTVVKEFP